MTFWFLWIVGLLVACATGGIAIVIGSELYARYKYHGNRKSHSHHRGQAGIAAPIGSGGTALEPSRSARIVQRATSTQEIVAYRRWRFACSSDFSAILPATNDWRLYSVVYLVPWEGPTLVADEIPSLHTRHGIYALRSIQLVQENFGSGLYLGHGPQVEGEVALSGTVIEGEYGYQAERATVRQLWFLRNPLPDDAMPGLIAEFEQRYQCEVRWTPSHQEAA